jgi:hypothetical protein
MKLLLQLVFVQGWLWRHCFPEVFVRAKTQRMNIGWWVILPMLLVLVGVAQLAEEAWSAGVPLLAFGVLWLIWQASSRGIHEKTGKKEFRISLSWGSGFVFMVMLLGSTAVAVVTANWPLLLLSVAVFLCSGSGWLRGIEANYIFFRDPTNNMWRLEDRPPEKGLVRPLVNLWVETYWRLPSEILFPQREHHA